ncbi:MAG: ferredoxin--nitrite reductase [Elainellaceae cyanobacterium]
MVDVTQTSNSQATKKLNKIERAKAKKHPLLLEHELDYFAQIGWEAMDEFERDHGLKWLGFFHRTKTPGFFMLRMRIPNGILTSGQMQALAEIIQGYCQATGFQTQGNADITTRQNLQIRGIRLEDIPAIIDRLKRGGLTSVQSGMDNVRNITGSPVAGIDANELIDTRGIVRNLQDMITNNGDGNLELSNLPRKFNIAVAGGRDNSVHAEINDIGFVPAYQNADPTSTLGFNIIVGGYFAPNQYVAAIPLNAWIPPEDVLPFTQATMIVYRDHGPRENRQKCRMMHLINAWGVETFRQEVEKQLGKPLSPAAAKDEVDWNKRDHIGVHAQKQPGFNYVGLHVPVGRLYPSDMFELARLAEVYGSGEIRLTLEQNLIIPNVPDTRLPYLLEEPPLQERFTIDPNYLDRGLVSCTGSEFCSYAIIETKNRAMAMLKELEQELEQPRPVRIHWTGCPNSCGQPQIADIGFIGTKTRKNDQTVEAVDIWLGGKVGKDAHFGKEIMKRVACEDLKPILRDLLIEHFDAKPR